MTTPKRPFHTASDAEIKSGEVSDVYFVRTVEILRQRNDRKRVKAEIYGIASHDLYHAGQIQILKRLMQR